MLLLRIWTLLWLVNAVTAVEGNAAICKLHLQGSGGPSKFTAGLRCQGSTVVAAVNPRLSSAIASNSSGVLWRNTGTTAGCDAKGCLLTVCNGTAVFQHSRVSVTTLASDNLVGVVCIAGSSHITIEGGAFQDNAVSSNQFLIAGSYGALVVRGNATVSVVNATFANNTATSLLLPIGAGILVGGTATVHVTSSRLVSNRCTGGVYAGGAGTPEATRRSNCEH